MSQVGLKAWGGADCMRDSWLPAWTGRRDAARRFPWAAKEAETRQESAVLSGAGELGCCMARWKDLRRRKGAFLMGYGYINPLPAFFGRSSNRIPYVASKRKCVLRVWK